MKKSIWTMIIVLSVVFVFCFKVTAARKLWVSSGNAKIKAKKSASSATIAKLSLGAELLVITTEKKWYEVEVISSKSRGWIYKRKVSEEKPEDDLEDDDEDLMDDQLLLSSVDAYSADTSRSIRGRKVKKKGKRANGAKKPVANKKPYKQLSPQAAKYGKKMKIHRDMLIALDTLLSTTVTDDEIDLFLKKGKIGEYAQ